ncbi:hypothetical protein [Natrinema soli]|uniref:Uncharacterized protein n=1 Tax=Natrinema soli TaxID=1930624 RepID=A0ABD5SLP7_9EURY|nr:hypothetical protein [Natrinema soli]
MIELDDRSPTASADSRAGRGTIPLHARALVRALWFVVHCGNFVALPTVIDAKVISILMVR